MNQIEYMRLKERNERFYKKENLAGLKRMAEAGWNVMRGATRRNM